MTTHIQVFLDMFLVDCGDGSGGALESVLGQDLCALSESVDFLAPMTYHHMIHQSTAYIGEVIQNHREFIKDRIPVVPSVQVKELYRKEVLPPRRVRGSFEDGVEVLYWRSFLLSVE